MSFDHPHLRRWLAVAACGIALSGQAAEPGADHPAVPRYPGATMEGFDFKEYEEGQLVLSKPVSKGSEMVAEKLTVEGRVTYLHYENPVGSSALQVFRNHQSALQRSGFKELFVCNRPCGENHFGNWRPLLKARQLYLNGGSEDLFYAAAQRGDTYVSLAVNSMSGKPHTWVFVIEKAPLDDQRIAVQGNGPIAQGLAQGGRVDVYGFKFDTGKTALKPESAPTLQELAQVLKENPTLSIDVVGHTDNVGPADANQILSLGRAQAVTTALVAEHGVAAGRLFASGRGDTQPVAPNSADEGRAKNRRVEIALHAGAHPAAPPVRPTPTAAPPAQTAIAEPPPPKEEDKVDAANKLLDAAKRLKELLGR